jgi:hypothetical protein
MDLEPPVNRRDVRVDRVAAEVEPIGDGLLRDSLDQLGARYVACPVVGWSCRRLSCRRLLLLAEKLGQTPSPPD